MKSINEILYESLLELNVADVDEFLAMSKGPEIDWDLYNKVAKHFIEPNLITGDMETSEEELESLNEMYKRLSPDELRAFLNSSGDLPVSLDKLIEVIDFINEIGY
jgi:hypothetical protein